MHCDNPISRRSILTAGMTTTLAGVRLLPVCGQSEQAPRSILIDTHLHCFAGPQDARFPYHEQAPYRPQVPATPEHLLSCMDQAGVAFAVVVHPEPYQDDHRYLEHCLQVGQGRLKGTLLLFADRPGSLEHLPRLVRRMAVVALRVHAYAPDRLPPFGRPELTRLWKMATDHGLAVQLHFEPRYAAGFEPLIREFSTTTVIVDHLGRPMLGTPQEHERVMNWARYPNVIIKYSAIPDQNKYPHRDVRPIINRIVSDFGPDRMIYGGGFGADTTGATYRAAFARARQLLADLPEVEQAKILGVTAQRLFAWA